MPTHVDPGLTTQHRSLQCCTCTARGALAAAVHCCTLPLQLPIAQCQSMLPDRTYPTGHCICGYCPICQAPIKMTANAASTRRSPALLPAAAGVVALGKVHGATASQAPSSSHLWDALQKQAKVAGSLAGRTQGHKAGPKGLGRIEQNTWDWRGPGHGRRASPPAHSPASGPARLLVAPCSTLSTWAG